MSFTYFALYMYIVFFLLSRPPWKSAIAEGVSVNKYSFNNNNNNNNNNVCPAEWTREYKGYLMAEHYGHHRTMYTCMDENPDYTQGTSADINGALFYFVEGECGSLPCKPYIAGRELTCAVCTR